MVFCCFVLFFAASLATCDDDDDDGAKCKAESTKKVADLLALPSGSSRPAVVSTPCGQRKERKQTSTLRSSTASQPASKHPTEFTQSTAQNKPESLSLNLSPRAIACIIWTNGKISHIKSSKKRRIPTESFRSGNPETIDTL